MDNKLALLDISLQQYQMLIDLLAQYLPNTTVWAYGSRVKGSATARSDLDMVVFTDDQQRNQVYDLKEAFEESDLLFRVDLFVWDDLPKNIQTNIERQYIVLAEKTKLD